MATLSEVIAANVRGQRAIQKWTQTELGEHIGAARSSVGDLESGRHKPTIDDLLALCRAFNVGLSKLLDGADPADLRVLGL